MSRLTDLLRRRSAPVPGPVGTRLGTDDGFRAVVDARASVHPSGTSRRVEWWIGGEDRWYAPAVEAAVRQDRPGPAPVLVTRMRVAGGDVVATTWATLASGSSGAAVVVELVNETPVPVAVAVTVQATKGGAIRRISVDGRRLLVDGETALVVDREPGRYAMVDAAADLWETVTGGRAVIAAPEPVRCRIGAAAGALVVPLPHRSALRFAVPAGDLVDNPSAVFPSAERVTAGWAGRLADAATVDLPDQSLAATAHPEPRGPHAGGPDPCRGRGALQVGTATEGGGVPAPLGLPSRRSPGGCRMALGPGSPTRVVLRSRRDPVGGPGPVGWRRSDGPVGPGADVRALLCARRYPGGRRRRPTRRGGKDLRTSWRPTWPLPRCATWPTGWCVSLWTDWTCSLTCRTPGWEVAWRCTAWPRRTGASASPSGGMAIGRPCSGNWSATTTDPSCCGSPAWTQPSRRSRRPVRCCWQPRRVGCPHPAHRPARHPARLPVRPSFPLPRVDRSPRVGPWPVEPECGRP